MRVRRGPGYASRSLFSGTNWLAMKVAPCGSSITTIRGPRGIDRPGDDLAAELERAGRGGSGVVDAEGDGPVRRRVGVVGRRSGSMDGDHVDEALRRTHVGHLLAKAGAALLEMIAVAGQRPHRAGGQVEHLPAEHGAVERLRRLGVPGGEPVEVQRAVLVDDLSRPCAPLPPRRRTQLPRVGDAPPSAPSP